MSIKIKVKPLVAAVWWLAIAYVCWLMVEGILRVPTDVPWYSKIGGFVFVLGVGGNTYCALEHLGKAIYAEWRED